MDDEIDEQNVIWLEPGQQDLFEKIRSTVNDLEGDFDALDEENNILAEQVNDLSQELAELQSELSRGPGNH